MQLKHLLPLLYALAPLVAMSQQQMSNEYELVMTSLRTGETELFITNISSGDTRNLTRSPKSEDRYPAVSPDGKWILFTSNRWNNDTTFNLFQIKTNGTGLKQLTYYKDEVVYYPCWSADGKSILYNLGKSSSAVLITADGKKVKSFNDVRDANLSPDGSQLAFTRQCGEGFCLFTQNVQTGTVRQLTRTPNAFGAVGPVFSPDGKSIAFVDHPQQSGDVLEIYLCDVNGQNLRRLTQLNKISTSPCWSPDGKWLSFRVTNDAFWREAATREAAYLAKEGDKRPVWIVDIDSAEPKSVEPLKFQCGIDGSRAGWVKK